MILLSAYIGTVRLTAPIKQKKGGNYEYSFLLYSSYKALYVPKFLFAVSAFNAIISQYFLFVNVFFICFFYFVSYFFKLKRLTQGIVLIVFDNLRGLWF